MFILSGDPLQDDDLVKCIIEKWIYKAYFDWIVLSLMKYGYQLIKIFPWIMKCMGIFYVLKLFSYPVYECRQWAF